MLESDHEKRARELTVIAACEAAEGSSATGEGDKGQQIESSAFSSRLFEGHMTMVHVEGTGGQDRLDGGDPLLQWFRGFLGQGTMTAHNPTALNVHGLPHITWPFPPTPHCHVLSSLLSILNSDPHWKQLLSTQSSLSFNYLHILEHETTIYAKLSKRVKITRRSDQYRRVRRFVRCSPLKSVLVTIHNFELRSHGTISHESSAVSFK